MPENDFAQFIIIWCSILFAFALLFRMVDQYHDRKTERMRIDGIKAQIDEAFPDDQQKEELHDNQDNPQGC